MGVVSGNRLGLTFHVDTNFVGDDAPASVELRRLDPEGWITISSSDVLSSELARDDNLERRERLRDEAEQHPEIMSPFVIGESRLGFSLIATDEDDALLASVFSTLYPYTDRHSESNTASHRRRDAMHVAAALRMGVNVFVTRDKPMLKRAAEVRALFNGFSIMDPEGALAFANRLRRNYEHRQGDGE